MLTIRKSAERGQTNFDWLASKHSFSFGRYIDRTNMGFGPLRVINDDIVKPGAGFDMHPHENMEILTLILEGALTHRDSLGTGSTIRPGDVQRMSAGRGILHSEFNASDTDPVHLLQIWIMPNVEDIAPEYEQKNFSDKRKPGQLTLLASPDGREGSLTIHQDASMAVLDLDAGQSFSHTLPSDYSGWVQVARGDIILNDEELEEGDGVATGKGEKLNFRTVSEAEVLIFTLPD
jgi:redox-sensitive bicupin YhaK (pirin superfamily)